MGKQGGGLKRRSFLTDVAAAGAVGVTLAGASGCAGGLGMASGRELRDLARMLAGWRPGLDAVNELSVISDGLAQLVGAANREHRSDELENYLDRADAMARRMCRTLFVAGAVHDLPPEARDSDEFQRAIEELGPEIDETVAESVRLLASCPAEERQHLADALGDDPDLVMRVAEQLDVHARSCGLGPRGRAKLRQTASHTAERLLAGHPSFLVDDCVDKMERMARYHERRGADVRWSTTELMRSPLWGEPDLLAVATTAKEEGPRSRRQRSGRGVLIAGGVVTGLGAAATIALGVVLPSTVPLWTVGAIVILTGLILVLSGAARRERDRVQDADRASIEDASLDALAGRTSVAGNIMVEETDLSSLDALGSLTSLAGGLFINRNAVLADVNDLRHLTSIGGYLTIRDNPALSDLDGLNSLTSVGARLGIAGNSALSGIDGLNSLTTVGGRMWIVGNDALTNLAGLSSLVSVGGGLSIRDNAALPTCAAEALVAQLRSHGWTGTANISGNDDTGTCE